MAAELTTIDTSDGAMPAHLWRPDSVSGPGILLLQEIFGISDYIVSRAEDLAQLGYVVLAPEIYWRIGASKVAMGDDALTEALGLVQQLDWDAAVGDGVASLQHLRGLPEVEGGVGIVGFCFGGGLGFSVAAASDPDALVSYYGSSLPGSLELAPAVTAPALYHFGLADSYIDADALAQVEEALAGRPEVTFETYPGADHAFDNPDFGMHHPEASALAWERTASFLGGATARMSSASTVQVPPGRFERWVQNFTERHDGCRLSVVSGALTGQAGDGSSFTAHPPFAMSYDGAAEVAGFAETCVPPDRWGVLLVRKGGFAIARLEREKTVESKVGQRHVQGRTKAGGQSQQRFARRRDNQARVAYEAAAEHAARILDGARLIVTGGDHTAVEAVLTDRRLAGLVVAPPFLTVADPRRAILEQAVIDAGSVRVEVINA